MPILEFYTLTKINGENDSNVFKSFHSWVFLRFGSIMAIETIAEKFAMTLIVVFVLASIAHSFDCPIQNLSQLSNESKLMVDGEIVAVTDSSFSFLVTKNYKNEADTFKLIEVMKGRESSDGISGYGPPSRWKKYEIDEKLFLFLLSDEKTHRYWSMGCYFEGEVVRFGDSLSFAWLRVNNDPYCHGCKVFHIDSLYSEIERDGVSDSLKRISYKPDSNSSIGQGILLSLPYVAAVLGAMLLGMLWY